MFSVPVSACRSYGPMLKRGTAERSQKKKLENYTIHRPSLACLGHTRLCGTPLRYYAWQCLRYLPYTTLNFLLPILGSRVYATRPLTTFFSYYTTYDLSPSPSTVRSLVRVPCSSAGRAPFVVHGSRCMNRKTPFKNHPDPGSWRSPDAQGLRCDLLEVVLRKFQNHSLILRGLCRISPVTKGH